MSPLLHVMSQQEYFSVHSLHSRYETMRFFCIKFFENLIFWNEVTSAYMAILQLREQMGSHSK